MDFEGWSKVESVVEGCGARSLIVNLQTLRRTMLLGLLKDSVSAGISKLKLVSDLIWKVRQM